MARVRLERVRKVFDTGAVAVHDVSLDIADGELVVLVGPSGCGKTTTLRMIAGLEPLSGGSLYIGERLVNDLPPKARDIAMVFQNYALYPHMSVYENMAFALTLRKLPRSEIAARVHRAAEILGIEPLLRARPRQLSGGQRQRVAIGRAIVREPAVFLFDEPLSNLDAKLRVQMRREISALHQQLGATMVYVTHDQVEAMTMGDRIVVMRAGYVQQVGAPLELYGRPANTFVAGFIGSPAMNLLPGALQAAEGTSGALRVRIEGSDAVLPLTPEQGVALAGRSGSAVIAGIRPEQITLWDGARGRDALGRDARGRDALGGDALERAPEGGAIAPGLPDLPEHGPDRAAEPDAARGTGDHIALFRVALELVEPLGNEILLHAHLGSAPLTARIAPRELPRAGEVVTLAVHVARVHYFDAESEGRIL